MAGAFAEAGGHPLVEGLARVVGAEGGRIWLEPEQTSTCGGCHSAAACGVKSGQNTRRLEARRFVLDNEAGLKIGERVVVGISEYALIRASSIAYAVPLLSMIGGAVAAQLTFGNDGAAMIAAVAGLGFGVLVARGRAGRLLARGELTPRFLRRIAAGEECHVD
ncbi:MAG TPA: SoxR reducing system RseC family protein [Rhodospirillaceae bacterium]|nr:SoxR reducing system RseC family protein [Rhodospirillaceae bacterium]